MAYFNDTTPKEKDTHKLSFWVEVRGPGKKVEEHLAALLAVRTQGVQQTKITTTVEEI